MKIELTEQVTESNVEEITDDSSVTLKEELFPSPVGPPEPKDILEIYANEVLSFNLDEKVIESKPELGYDASGLHAYLQMCNEINVVPSSYFIKHLKDTTMNLKFYGLGPKGAKAICHALYTNPYIQKMDLSYNFLGNEGILYVCELLKESSFLTEMDLSHNSLGTEAAKLLGELLYSNPAHLKKISLSGNNFNDTDANYFAYGLDGNDRLTDIDLSHNGLGVQAGQILGAQLGTNNILEYVDLSWNHFRGAGVPSICTAIRLNLQLNYLNLSNNGLGDEGGAIIGKGLTSNTTLQFLDIGNCSIGDVGTMAIAKALEKNETLLTLKMKRNPMGADGTSALIKAMTKNNALKDLDLTDIYVTREFESTYNSLKETRELTIKYEGITGDFEIPLKTRRETDITERMTRAKATAKTYAIKLEKFIAILDREELTAIELRTILEKKGHMLKVHADEIAICLSSDGNIYCENVIEELQKIPDEEPMPPNGGDPKGNKSKK